MGFSDLWKKISESDSFIPSRIEIDREHTDVAAKIAEPFQRHKQYFSVVINEMFLTKGRQWFSEFAPAVFVVSEFIYDGKREAVPYVVGPSALEGKMDSANIPEGFVFENTTVAGLHPYRGGSFSLSIVLGKIRTDHYLRRILRILENTAGTYLQSFGKMISQYIKVANVVLDGIDALIKEGDLTPLAGRRLEFQPDTVHAFNPGYFVLINAPEKNYSNAEFFIRNNRLYHGESAASAVPFREADYVLYSILPADSRSDIDVLPFNKQFQDLQSFIAGMMDIGEEEKKLINARVFALQDSLRMSPDLTRGQVEELIAEYRSEIKTMISSRQPLSDSKETEQEKDPWEKQMDKQALEILNFN